MPSIETIRRRVKSLQTELDKGYSPWMHDKGYYLPADDPRNKWTDENGWLHIEVPAKLTPLGKRLGVPHTELILDIPRTRASDDLRARANPHHTVQDATRIHEQLRAARARSPNERREKQAESK